MQSLRFSFNQSIKHLFSLRYSRTKYLNWDWMQFSCIIVGNWFLKVITQMTASAYTYAIYISVKCLKSNIIENGPPASRVTHYHIRHWRNIWCTLERVIFNSIYLQFYANWMCVLWQQMNKINFFAEKQKFHVSIESIARRELHTDAMVDGCEYAAVVHSAARDILKQRERERERERHKAVGRLSIMHEGWAWRHGQKRSKRHER